MPCAEADPWASPDYGATDDVGYNVTEIGVHVHDFNATIMHFVGIDHERLTLKYQGRRLRLTDVHGGVINEIISRTVNRLVQVGLGDRASHPKF